MKYIPYHEYEKIRSLNATFIKAMRRSPLHAMTEQMNEHTTDEMNVGLAVHCLTLEPGRYINDFAEGPDCGPRNRKEGKDAWAAFVAENPGKSLLTFDQATRVRTMHTRLMENPIARRYLIDLPGSNEQTIEWKRDGVDCKGRMDRYVRGDGWEAIVDLKTTTDASQYAFQGQVIKLGYYIAAAWYEEGAEANGLHPSRHILVAVENEEPHGVAVYELTPDWIEHAKPEITRLVRQYRDCLAANMWPAYPEVEHVLTAPGWMQEEGVR